MRNIIITLVIGIIFLSCYMLKENELKIFFVDVGQGDCTLIVTPDSKKILIDGGGSQNSEYDVGESILKPYLLDRKIKRINYIIISHFDSDHVRTVFSL